MMVNHPLLLPLFLVSFFCCPLREAAAQQPHETRLGHHSSTAQCGTAGKFDYYVFARWYDRQFAPCGSYSSENLTLHGLWPSYLSAEEAASQGCSKSVRWPQYCLKNASNWNLVEHVEPSVNLHFNATWKQRAPRYVNSQNLGEHEWEKHGTCVTQNLTLADTQDAVAQTQTAFFQKALDLDAEFPTPAQIRAAQSSGSSPLTLAELQQAFGEKKVGLSCQKSKDTGQIHLTMVELCFNVSQDSLMPSEQIDCPPIVTNSSSDDSCAKANAIYVNQACHSNDRAETEKEKENQELAVPIYT